MKLKLLKAALFPAALLAPVAGTYVWFFCGPFRFVDVPLHPQSLDHLLAQRELCPGPVEAADEYLNWRADPSERPARDDLEISMGLPSGDEIVVTVIERGIKDDSVSAACARLTLRLENGRWIPIRHQGAWQGRNSFGWSTNTPS